MPTCLPYRPAPPYRLAPFMLLAALLHLAALFGLHPPALPPLSQPRPLEVRFEQPAPPPAANFREQSPFSSGQLPRAHTNEVAPSLRRPSPAATAATATDASPLDVNKLLDQARAYARQAQNTDVATADHGLEGDYSGSYDGLDAGSFHFWLDRTGHGAGSGQSRRYGINFIIGGQVDTNGTIRMSGSGSAGEAQFSGTLDVATGEFSGKWMLPGKGGGTFRGRRDQALGQASPVIARIGTPMERLRRAMQQPHSETLLVGGMHKITTDAGTTVCYQSAPYFARDAAGVFGIPVTCP